MSEVNAKKKIIRITDDDVDKKYVKNLGNDKTFKFECENFDDKLRIGLKEIDAYSPYYYESFYSLEELYEKNDIFRARTNIEDLITSLLTLFENSGNLENSKGDNIIVVFKIPSLEKIELIEFELEKKTIDDKDTALLDLFYIQKDNIRLLNIIRKECKKKPKDPIYQKILECLNDKN